jgi:O-antigen ligase
MPAEARFRSVLPGSAAIIIICAVGVAVIGMESLAILPVILLVFLSLKYRNFLLYLFLATVPITANMFRPINAAYSYALVLLIMFLWLSRKLILEKEKICIWSPLVVFAISFLFVVLLSSLKGGISKTELAVMIRFLIFFPFLFVLYDFLNPRDIFKIVLSISIPLLFSAYFVFSTYLHAGGLFELMDLFRRKPAGFFTNSNVFAIPLIIVTPFWMALTWWHRSRFIKMLSLAIFLILFLALISGNSRAAFVGFFITVFLLAAWARKIRYLLALCSIVVIIIFSSPLVKTMVFASLRAESGSSGRVEVWKNSVNIISQNFWLGVGIGNFAEAYDPYYETAWERGFLQSAMGHSHNQLLTKMVEMGFLGFFITLAIYYLPIREAIRAVRRVRTIEDRAAVYGIIGGLIAIYGRSIFEGTGMLSSGGFYPDILFWIFFILLVKIAKSEMDPSEGIVFKNRSFGREAVLP